MRASAVTRNLVALVPRAPQQRGGRMTLCSAAAPLDMSERVVVAGGGVGGLAAALALTKCHIPVTVLEMSPKLRQEGTSLGLLSNAWKALEALSLADELRQVNPRCLRVEFKTIGGDEVNVIDLEESSEVAEMRGVIRRKLLQTLFDALPSDTVQFSSFVTSVDLTQQNRPVLTLQDGRQIRCRVLVGADGAKSQTAAALGLPPPTFRGASGIRGLSEFETLPIPPQTIYYFLGKGIRSGMYQVEHNKIYWFIACNAPEAIRMKNKEAVVKFAQDLAKRFGGPVQTCMENVDPECLSFANLSDRVLLNPFQSPGKGTVTLLGDALHPMTPNLGQGGALALEDAVVLAQCLSSAGGLSADDSSLAQALRRYEFERLKRAVPLTLRSRFVGNVLGASNEAIAAARNFLLSKVNLKEAYVSTARFDCGSLISS